MLMPNFGVTDKEYYGMLWYFGVVNAVSLDESFTYIPDCWIFSTQFVALILKASFQ